MITREFSFTDDENVGIFYYKWSPENDIRLKGVVQISHGMAEVSGRYKRLAKALTSEGYIVYANDHRGHGKTAGCLKNVGYLGDADGFSWLVRDMHQLSQIIKSENPMLPLYLLGHSMGSFLSQRYVQLYGKEIAGLILSGTNGRQGLVLDMGIIIAQMEILFKGRKSRSKTLNDLSFGSYNNKFRPARTGFDWLSRDEKEVDKYIEDEYCGGVFTVGFFYDFFIGLKDIEKPSNMALVPRDLHIYIFSGEKDPVGGCTKGVLKLVGEYKSLGIKDITYRFYRDGRHEMLNEINRDEVISDLIGWLNLR
ncbi:MAG: lysophospholipase [Clostridiaceae bacterium]